MVLLQSEALTLRTYPYSEAHQIAVFLSRDFGKLRAMAYGARSRRRAFGSGLEPLTHVRISVTRKEQQELGVLKSCEIVRALPAYELSWEVNLHFGYFSELLLEFSNEEEAAERLFRLVLAVLGQIHEKPILLLARYLEFWLLRLEGVLPALEERLPSDLAARTTGFLQTAPAQLPEDLLTADDLKRLEGLAEELIEFQLERRLKTRKMLKELL